jgi:hypothetical protein
MPNYFSALADAPQQQETKLPSNDLKLGQEMEGLTISMKKSRLIHLRYDIRYFADPACKQTPYCLFLLNKA